MGGFAEEEQQPGRPVLSMRLKLACFGLIFFSLVGLATRMGLDAIAASMSLGSQSELRSYREVAGILVAICTDPDYTQGSTECMLLMYRDGVAEKLWSNVISGSVDSVTLADLDDDEEPELIAQTSTMMYGGPLFGARSLLIYQNMSGGFDLVLNISSPIQGYSEGFRSYPIDYYDNGKSYLISVFDSQLMLIGYDSGRPVVQQRLCNVSCGPFTVGDLNGDGRDDIVYLSEGGFTVRENEGNGKYSRTIVNRSIPEPMEMLIDDVDGDGENELVITGASWPTGVPTMSIWRHSVDGFREIWNYRGPWHVDHGGWYEGMGYAAAWDADGDMVKEVVLSGAMWDHGGNDTWVEKALPLHCDDLRSCDSSFSDGGSMLLGVGGDLVVVEREMGEIQTRHLALPKYGPGGNRLDVWPIKTGPIYSKSDLESILRISAPRLPQLQDDKFAGVLDAAIEAAGYSLAAGRLDEAGLLTLMVDRALSRNTSVITSPGARSVFDEALDIALRCLGEGWYGSAAKSLEAGWRISSLMQTFQNMSGGGFLIDQLWEAADELDTSPTISLVIASWCDGEEVKELAQEMFWIEESWRTTNASVSSRDALMVENLLTSAKTYLADRNTVDCEQKISSLRQKLEQLSVEVPVPYGMCLLFLLGLGIGCRSSPPTW